MKCSFKSILFVLFIAPGLASTVPLQTAGDKEQRKSHEQQKIGDPSRLPAEVKVDSEPKRAASESRSGEWQKWFWPPSWSDWGLLIVACLAARIALRTLTAIDRQANIADRTLALTQRPRIKMRAFAVNDDIFEYGDHGHMINLTYEVVNYGGTDATITDSNCTIRFRHTNEVPDLPLLPPYDTCVGNQIIEPGMILRGAEARRVSKIERVQEEIEDTFALNHFHIYVIGYMTYIGSIGPHYRTGFCRRIEVKDYKPVGFSVVPNPNYEYED